MSTKPQSQQERPVDWLDTMRRVFEEIILESCIFVVCLDHSLTTTRIHENGDRSVELHITKPQVSQIGKRIGSITKQYHDVMCGMRDKMSRPEIQIQYITRDLKELCRSTVYGLSNTNTISKVFKDLTLTLLYQDSECFKLICVSYDKIYDIRLHLFDLTPTGKIVVRKKGCHKTSENYEQSLNPADMMQWLMDILSPNVVAHMNFR
jgi:hypothetical protein